MITQADIERIVDAVVKRLSSEFNVKPSPDWRRVATGIAITEGWSKSEFDEYVRANS